MTRKLENRKKFRIDDLVNSGMSRQEAELTVENEFKELAAIEIAELETKCDSDETKWKQLLKSNFEDDAKRIQKQHEISISALQDRLLSERKVKEQNLRDKLDKLRKLRKTEIMSSNFALSEDEAENQLILELSPGESMDFAKLNTELNDSSGLSCENVKLVLDRDLSILKDRYEASVAILENGWNAKKNAEHKKLENILSAKRANREMELRNNGVSENELASIVETELGPETKDLFSIVDTKLLSARQMMLDCIETDFSSRSMEIISEHEIKLLGLQAALQNRKLLEAKLLRERLARKRESRTRDLECAGISFDEARSIAESEFGEIILKSSLESQDKNIEKIFLNKEEQIRELLNRAVETNKLDNESLSQIEDVESTKLRMELFVSENNLMLNSERVVAETLTAAILASKDVQDSTDDKLKALKERHERELEKLNSDLLHKKTREQSLLQQRLIDRRNKYERDLISNGISNEDAKLEASKQFLEDENSQNLQLSADLKNKQTEIIQRKHRDNADEEVLLLNKEHLKAVDGSARAQKIKDDARQRLEELRRQHDEETTRLQNLMSNKKSNQENNLRARLAEKKFQKLKELEISNASEELQRREADSLSQLEHDSFLELQRTHALEESQAREILKAEHEARLTSAKIVMQNAEIEVAAMVTKETSLNAAREMKTRVAEDLQRNELRRIRDLHSVEEERSLRDENSLRRTTKGKLEERLQAKKLKKIKELEFQEAKALQELSQQHATEAEERENLRKSKLVWKDVLKDAMNKAAEMGLIGLEREDFCFQELLGKNLVPEKHINEVVQRVQNLRHTT